MFLSSRSCFPIQPYVYTYVMEEECVMSHERCIKCWAERNVHVDVKDKCLSKFEELKNRIQVIGWCKSSCRFCHCKYTCNYFCTNLRDTFVKGVYIYKTGRKSSLAMGINKICKLFSSHLTKNGDNGNNPKY